MPDPLIADMKAFLAAVSADVAFKPSDFGVKMTPGDALARLAEAYSL